MSCHSDDHNKKGDMLRYYIDQIEQRVEQRIKDKIVRGLDEKPRYMGEKIGFVGAFHTEEPQLLYGGARRNGRTTAIFEWAKAMYALYVTLEEELAQVEKERDAAIADLKDAEAANCDCWHCRHFKDLDDGCEADCDACARDCKCKGCIDKALWEWRGVQEE